MGRPYAEEILALTKTYEWAQRCDLDQVRQAVLASSSMPLVAVGSGGSITTAAWLTHLHRRTFGALAHTATPLQLDGLLPTDRRAAVWLLSASGRNTDILSALQTALLHEPRQLVALCAAPRSPLEDKAAEYPWTTRLSFAVPNGRDGFLATNSLFASCTLLARAYLAATNDDPLPETLDTLLGPLAPSLRELDTQCEPLWKRRTLLVLHGNVGHVSAIDIESRFTEAALGSVQLADFRNFAHGRHHWLAKHGGDSAVLAITDPQTTKLAERTLRLLPKEVPVAKYHMCDDTIRTSLSGIYLSLCLAGSAGRAKSIDPGRPGVPDFGRRIYGLRPPTPTRFSPSGVSLREAIAIERKTGRRLHSLVDSLQSWRDARTAALDTIQTSQIGSIVFDYDGTIVETNHRHTPPSPEIVAQIVRLLKSGMPIGIATGRGHSVREALHSTIPPRYWSSVIVGYRNGSEVAPLSDVACPSGTTVPCTELRSVANQLMRSPHAQTFDIKLRSQQITVQSRFHRPDGWLWTELATMLQRDGLTAKLLRTGHSVDILPLHVSKTSVVSFICNAFSIPTDAILRIGDRGKWPGNDFELLDHPLGLSVDEVSDRQDACWNFADPGTRGVGATIRYASGVELLSKRGPRRFGIQIEPLVHSQ